MKKKLIFWLICIFMVGLGSQITLAIPPVQTFVSTTKGIEIEYPPTDYLALNSDMIFHFHLYNISNGVPLYNNSEGGIKCLFHLYNSTGSHIYITTISAMSHETDFEVKVDGGNFSRVGEYSYLMACNSSTQGGFVAHDLIINTTGEEPSLIKGVFHLILFLVLIVLTTLTILGAYCLDGKNKYDFGGKLIKINVNKYIKIGLFFISYLFLIVIFLFCEIMAREFLIISFAEGIFHVLFILSAVCLFPILLGTLVLWFLRIIVDFYAYKLKKRGLKPR